MGLGRGGRPSRRAIERARDECRDAHRRLLAELEEARADSRRLDELEAESETAAVVEEIERTILGSSAMRAVVGDGFSDQRTEAELLLRYTERASRIDELLTVVGVIVRGDLAGPSNLAVALRDVRAVTGADPQSTARLVEEYLDGVRATVSADARPSEAYEAGRASARRGETGFADALSSSVDAERAVISAFRDRLEDGLRVLAMVEELLVEDLGRARIVRETIETALARLVHAREDDRILLVSGEDEDEVRLDATIARRSAVLEQFHGIDLR